jgi:hypothetical protein
MVRVKFVVSLQFVYDVPDDEDLRILSYGTSDPEEMAKIDQENFQADPGKIHSLMESDEYTITVRPA